MKTTLASLFVYCFALSIGNAASIPNRVSGLNLVSGKTESVDLSRGKLGTVVAFVSSVCPCSSSHTPHLNELAKKFSDFQFVGVLSNSDETAEKAGPVFAANRFPVIMDEKAKLADAFGAVKTPHVFVLNPDGKIVFKGGVSDASNFKSAEKRYLEEALSAMRSGKSPPQAEARALGCYISRE